MRRLLAVVVIGALAGCAEVTRVTERDGSTAYMIDCGSAMPRLESCRAAMRRTCPGGYTVLPERPSGPRYDRPIHGAQMFRCTPPPSPPSPPPPPPPPPY